MTFFLAELSDCLSHCCRCIRITRPYRHVLRSACDHLWLRRSGRPDLCHPIVAGLLQSKVTTTPGGLKAGTFADTNTAPFNNSNSLTMYLRFSPIAPVPLAGATLSFSFVDLDLIGGSDRTGFTETLKVYGAGGSALAPTITMLGQSGLTPFAFNVSGNSTSQTITFSDVRSLVLGDPFYVKLVFGANMTADGKWQNTLEAMTATLTTTVTPEPSSLLLFGSGLAAFVAWRFGRRKPE